MRRAANDSIRTELKRTVPPRTRRPARGHQGQVLVEFAFCSFIFFAVVFGTIDFGRSIFMYSQLHNAVREGARVGKVQSGNVTAVQDAVIAKSGGLGLSSSGITVTCSGACEPDDGAVTVVASIQFTAITQELLGIGPITLEARATDQIE